MSKSYLLINEPPLTVSPTLAKIIGLDEAIVIQQVHYWLMNAKNAGRVEEGEKWVYNSYEEWQEGNFPFWTTDKIQRLFLKLEKQGLIISRQFDAKSRDMTKFYRLAYDEICALHDSFLRPSIDANLHDVKMNQRLPENTSSEVHKTDEVQPKYKAIPQNMPLEWYVQHGQPIPEDLTRKNAEEAAALSAFESAFGIDRPWNWYPAKSTQEREWRELREYLIELHRADPDCFTGYAKWAGDKYSRGAKNASQIRSDPGAFPTAWAAYKVSGMYVNPTSQSTTYTDDEGIPLT